MELDNVLWRESENIAIKRLWEYLCTYCYLPRLANENVLNDAIQTGVNSTEYFAIASGYDGSRYIDLKFNQFIGMVEKSGYLVKADVALKQITEEEAKRQAEVAAITGNSTNIPAGATNGGDSFVYGTPEGTNGTSTVREDPQTSTQIPKNKRFFMSADLDTTRINRDVQKYVEEIIQHLTSVDGAQVKVSLEVEAQVVDGFTQQTMRTISENCRTLRVRDSGFEE